MEDLIQYGLVVPVVRAGRDKIRCTKLLQPDVEDFLARLEACCIPMTSLPDAVMSLLQTRHYLRIDVMLAAIFGGAVIPEKHDLEKRALRTIFIKTEDVKRLKKLIVPNDITPTEIPLELPRPDFYFWRQRIADLKKAGR
jgi:hypothetical protein